MTLPEQITEERLREELESKMAALDEKLDDPELPKITEVTGASPTEQARGRAELRVNGTEMCPVSNSFYRVNVSYENLPAVKLGIKTSPARLIKANEHWRTEGFLADWARYHELPMPEDNSLTLSFLVPGRELVLDRPKPKEKRREGAGYHIPPLATHIRGHGELVYWTGQEMKIIGEKTLGRPAADGSLRVRPGGIYATFYGDQAPEVRLGNSWIHTRPIS